MIVRLFGRSVNWVVKIGVMVHVGMHWPDFRCVKFWLGFLKTGLWSHWGRLFVFILLICDKICRFIACLLFALDGVSVEGQIRRIYTLSMAGDREDVLVCSRLFFNHFITWLDVLQSLKWLRCVQVHVAILLKESPIWVRSLNIVISIVIGFSLEIPIREVGYDFVVDVVLTVLWILGHPAVNIDVIKRRWGL